MGFVEFVAKVPLHGLCEICWKIAAPWAVWSSLQWCRSMSSKSRRLQLMLI